jgi:hypothetical protein
LIIAVSLAVTHISIFDGAMLSRRFFPVNLVAYLPSRLRRGVLSA